MSSNVSLPDEELKQTNDHYHEHTKIVMDWIIANSNEDESEKARAHNSLRRTLDLAPEVRDRIPLPPDVETAMDAMISERELVAAHHNTEARSAVVNAEQEVENQKKREEHDELNEKLMEVWKSWRPKPEETKGEEFSSASSQDATNSDEANVGLA
ncbi:MAG: hypothetical protein Q9168_005079 [Polycauliona sp. 1 TL-2023]